MHQCLQIPELVERVFEFSTQDALASSATACNWWSEPALNALWGIYGSLEAILFLTDLDDSSLPKTTRRTLRHYDLEQVRRYSTTKCYSMLTGEKSSFVSNGCSMLRIGPVF